MTSKKYDHLQATGTITGKFHQNPLKTVGGVAKTRLTAKKLLKGHNSDKNQSSITSIKYAHLQVMATISGKFNKNPLKTVGGVAETRLTVEQLLQGHNSGKNQLSTTRIKYDHLQVMATISGTFRQNPLKTVGGVADTRTSDDKMAESDKGP